jgi:hypothetical protein
LATKELTYDDAQYKVRRHFAYMPDTLPMPTAEEARAAFGNDFNPDTTLNGAIALAAAGDLAGPALALMRAVFACPAADARLREAMIVRTAVRLSCIYAVHSSTRIALNSGLSKNGSAMFVMGNKLGHLA